MDGDDDGAAAAAAAAAGPTNSGAAAAARPRSRWRALQSEADSILRWLQSGDVRAAVELAQLAASLLFILLYIWSTYAPEAPGSWRHWVDVGLCCVFAVDYAYRVAVGVSAVMLGTVGTVGAC